MTGFKQRMLVKHLSNGSYRILELGRGSQAPNTGDRQTVLVRGSRDILLDKVGTPAHDGGTAPSSQGFARAKRKRHLREVLKGTPL